MKIKVSIGMVVCFKIGIKLRKNKVIKCGILYIIFCYLCLNICGIFLSMLNNDVLFSGWWVSCNFIFLDNSVLNGVVIKFVSVVKVK